MCVCSQSRDTPLRSLRDSIDVFSLGRSTPFHLYGIPVGGKKNCGLIPRRCLPSSRQGLCHCKGSTRRVTNLRSRTNRFSLPPPPCICYSRATIISLSIQEKNVVRHLKILTFFKNINWTYVGLYGQGLRTKWDHPPKRSLRSIKPKHRNSGILS